MRVLTLSIAFAALAAAQITSIPGATGGGGSPSGSSGAIQINNGGVFGAANAHNASAILNCNAASASGTAYTCSTSPSFTPAAGDAVLFKADVANTGSATLAVNGAAAATIKKLGNSTNLVANDLLAGQVTFVFFDGTVWQIVTNSAGSNPTSANLLATNGSGVTTTATAHNVVGVLNCAAGSASGTAYTCSTTPSFTPASGDSVLFKADVANTGAATLAVNGATAAALKKLGNVALVANDLIAGQWTAATYDGTNWQVATSSTSSGLAPASSSVLSSNSAGTITAATGHGVAAILNCNAGSASGTTYTCSTSPTFTPASGDAVLFKADVANTGSATLNVNSAGAKTFKKYGGSTNLVANDLAAGQVVYAFYDGTNWQLQNIGSVPAGSNPPASVAVLGSTGLQAFTAATGSQVLSTFQTFRYSTVGSSITAQVNQCISDLGGGNPNGTCVIDTTPGEILNTLPWTCNHNENYSLRINVHGTLTICDGTADAHGDSCAAAFSLCTGNGGGIFGEGTAPGSHTSNSIIKAGSLETNVPLVIWGDNIAPSSNDDFGTQIRDIQVDCNNNTGMTGIYGTSTQENSLMLNWNVKQCGAGGVPAVWLSSSKTSNSWMANGNISMSVNGGATAAYTSASIPLLWANAANMRPIYGLTIQGNNNGPAINISGATGTSNSSNVGTLTSLPSYSKLTFGTNLGPNSTPSYVVIQNVTPSGWNGTWPILSNTSCTVNNCTGMTIQLNSNPGNITATGTLNLVPTYGVVACAGNCSSYYSGDSSSSTGPNNFASMGFHIERMGIGVGYTASAGLGAVSINDSCSSTVNTCAQIENFGGTNAANMKNMVFLGLQSGGAPTTLNDVVTGRAITGSYMGFYMGGTSPNGATNDPLYNMGAPLSFVEIAAPSTTANCKTGIDTTWADSTAHRVKGCDNAGSIYQFVHSGADVNTSDQVTGLNGTSLGGLATGILKNTTTTGVPTIAAAGTDFTLGAPVTMYCTGTIAASTTIILPSAATNSSACSTTTTNIKYPIAAGHVIKNLMVRVQSAPNAASGATVTIMRNAAVSTGVTCTLATSGTTCSDTTDSYTVASSDVFYAQVQSNTGETNLANVAVTFEVR